MLAVLAALGSVLLAGLLYSLLGPLRYWQRRGVPCSGYGGLRLLPWVGHMAPLLLRRATFSQMSLAMAESFRQHGCCGLYQWHAPVLLVWDPDMAKQILTRDFGRFHGRGQPTHDGDPVGMHLFNLEGPRWRNLRLRLSPTFSSAKIKLMYSLMKEVADELRKSVEVETASSTTDEVDLRDLLCRYATDVIGTCAFGIRCDSLRNRDSEFLAMSRSINRVSPWALLRIYLGTVHPKLVHLIPWKFIVNDAKNFFLALVKDTTEYRKRHSVDRNDFLNQMMQLQEADRSEEDRVNHVHFTVEVMTAQTLLFFAVGVGSVANTVGFCLQQLALSAELQERAAGEVREVVARHGGQLTSEALRRMGLIERILKEGLRIWSPSGFLFRKCQEPTLVGGVAVQRGQLVLIAADTMHRSAELYPEPGRFDPERFTQEAREGRHPYAFLPFGEGPRNCIAETFVMMEMKLALASLLNDFRFVSCTRTEKDPEIDLSSFNPQPKNGFWLKVEKRP